MIKPYLIIIAGGSGSGKSTFARKLQAAFPDDISVVACDHYYRKHTNVSEAALKARNFDHPDAIEWPLMREQLQSLMAGKSVDCPVYDQRIQNRTEKTFRITPQKVIVLEGILALHDEGIRELADLKIYVDVDEDVRLLRRIMRDVDATGRSVENIAGQYMRSVKEMHRIYVAPTRKMADIIINDALNPVTLDLVCSKIRSWPKGE